MSPGGVDFGTNASLCFQLVDAVRRAIDLPILAKLTPNVTDIAEIARAASDAGADAVSAINTVLGMAVDWRRRRPRLGNVVGGLSGPAIKPIALRCVHQIARCVPIPVIGIGGIADIDDAMEFFVAGATAIQVGTANYYRPDAAEQILDRLPAAIRELGCHGSVTSHWNVEPASDSLIAMAGTTARSSVNRQRKGHKKQTV